MNKKLKKLSALSICLLCLFQVIFFPIHLKDPEPDNNGNPPISVCSPGWGNGGNDRN